MKDPMYTYLFRTYIAGRKPALYRGRSSGRLDDVLMVIEDMRREYNNSGYMTIEFVVYPESSSLADDLGAGWPA